MAHDGSEGLSPDGWLPDRISVGVLTRAFPPDLVDEVVEATGTREQRRRLLPARLMVYFVLALWLFRGRNCGYGQVMPSWPTACTASGAALTCWPASWTRTAGSMRGRAGGGGSRTSPRCRAGRGKLGSDPVRMLFEHVAGPTGADGAPGVFCCGLRVVSMDGSTTDVPDSEKNAAYFGRPVEQPPGRRVPAGPVGGGGRVRDRQPAGRGTGRVHRRGAVPGPDLLDCLGPGMLVLADRNFLSWSLARAFLATGAHILWRASAAFTLKPVRVLDDGTYLAELKPPRKSDGPAITVRVIEYTVHTAAEDGGEETSEVFCLVTECATRRCMSGWRWETVHFSAVVAA